jgi:hypothetical protein
MTRTSVHCKESKQLNWSQLQIRRLSQELSGIH